jgi:hypothetical protein
VLLTSETLDKLKKLVKRQSDEPPTAIVKSKSQVRGRKSDRGGSATAAASVKKPAEVDENVELEPRKESPKKKSMKSSVSQASTSHSSMGRT